MYVICTFGPRYLPFHAHNQAQVQSGHSLRSHGLCSDHSGEDTHLCRPAKWSSPRGPGQRDDEDGALPRSADDETLENGGPPVLENRRSMAVDSHQHPGLVPRSRYFTLRHRRSSSSIRLLRTVETPRRVEIDRYIVRSNNTCEPSPRRPGLT